MKWNGLESQLILLLKKKIHKFGQNKLITNLKKFC